MKISTRNKLYLLIVIVVVGYYLTNHAIGALAGPKFNTKLSDINSTQHNGLLSYTEFTTNSGEEIIKTYEVPSGKLISEGKPIYGINGSGITFPETSTNSIQVVLDGKKKLVNLPITGLVSNVRINSSEEYIEIEIYPREFIAIDEFGNESFSEETSRELQLYVYDVAKNSWSDNLVAGEYQKLYDYYKYSLMPEISWNDVQANVLMIQFTVHVGLDVDDLNTMYEPTTVARYLYSASERELVTETSFEQGRIENFRGIEGQILDDPNVMSVDPNRFSLKVAIENIFGFFITMPMRVFYALFPYVPTCDYYYFNEPTQQCFTDDQNIYRNDNNTEYIRVTNPMVGIQRLFVKTEEMEKEREVTSWFSTKGRFDIRIYRWASRDFVVLQMNEQLGVLDLRNGNLAKLFDVPYRRYYDAMNNDIGAYDRAYRIEVY